MEMVGSNNLELQLTGQSYSHIVKMNESLSQIARPVHRDIIGPFLDLQNRAKGAGFDLQIVSGFRDFDRQLSIWNQKVSGERPLYDFDGKLIQKDIIDPLEKIHRIMRWSALPGASRHHWGTDIDVFDAAAVDKNYEVQLMPEEVIGDGVFAPMHTWLDQQIRAGESCGFFRPYGVDRGGVAAERWHLSYAPVALEYQSRLNAEILRSLLCKVDLRLKETVLNNLDNLYKTYIALPNEFLRRDCRFV